jgi:hypothetical protein
MSEKIKAEEKLKQEIESLKRQLKFYKDKLQLEVNVKKTIQGAKKNTKAGNINPFVIDDVQKNEVKTEKEKEHMKNEAKIVVSNKIMKSAVVDSAKVHHLEICVNKFKDEHDRFSDNMKKCRKSVLLDEIEDCLNSNNNEEREKNKNNSNKYVQSHSPNKMFNLNIDTNANHKNKQINSVRLPHQVLYRVI